MQQRQRESKIRSSIEERIQGENLVLAKKNSPLFDIPTEKKEKKKTTTTMYDLREYFRLNLGTRISR